MHVTWTNQPEKQRDTPAVEFNLLSGKV